MIIIRRIQLLKELLPDMFLNGLLDAAVLILKTVDAEDFKVN